MELNCRIMDQTRLRTMPGQFTVLLEFMEMHGDIARHPPGPQARLRADRLWVELEGILNSIDGGVQKPTEKWKKVWADWKAKTKGKVLVLKKRNNTPGGTPIQLSLTDMEERLWALMQVSASNGQAGTQALGLGNGHARTQVLGPGHGHFGIQEFGPGKEPPQKLQVIALQDNFTKVKQCCLKLVKENLILSSVIDVEAFQDILKMIPMSSEERKQLTADAVMKLLEKSKDDDFEIVNVNDLVQEEVLEESNDTNPIMRTVKTEIETSNCTCSKDVTDSHHDDDCPAKLNYFNFFQVTPDTAVCSFCQKTINWNNNEDLKQHVEKHLKKKHSNLSVIFEDEEDLRSNSDSSSEDKEETFLEDNSDEPSRKRKKIEKEVVNTKREVKNNQSYRSLEKFGEYVASLLADIPKKRSMRLQIRIIEKLLEEQAAAG